MHQQSEIITKLEEFKYLLTVWHDGKLSPDTRTEINKLRGVVKRLVAKAGTLKSLTIGPPPMVGGVLMKNADPFEFIFDPMYGSRVIPILRDSIDETIGIFESNPALAEEVASPTTVKKPPKTSKRIFLVHGRNDGLKEQVARLLENIGLEPVILHEQPNAGRTIIEKFEEYSDVGFAVVLMNGDDEGGLNDGTKRYQLRARQNVVFELGYFIGKLGRNKVAAMTYGPIELPTDFSGVVYLGIDSNEAWKFMLAKEIKAAGIEIDTSKLI